ncbi:unnamed protein product [Rhizoctonia solani]|uniref:Inhibitor I9 domain-containing protein n=1 Tax=Rhizoctonia solani TaxID=456999 RepID=A0A8H3CFL7_9AGAM|nr:unnamed protein product [Rhizoctonia solani]
MSESFTVPISRASQNAIPNRYLVCLKEHADTESHINWLEQQIAMSHNESIECKVVYKYSLAKGYTAVLTGPVLEALTERDDVNSIAEDSQATW